MNADCLRPFECGICKRRYKQKQKLRSHISQTHKQRITDSKDLPNPILSDDPSRLRPSQSSSTFTPHMVNVNETAQIHDSSNIPCVESDLNPNLDEPRDKHGYGSRHAGKLSIDGGSYQMTRGTSVMTPSEAMDDTSFIASMSQRYDQLLKPPEVPGFPRELEMINISKQVFSFYENFADESETLYCSLSKLFPPLNELHMSCRDLLTYCTRHQLTSGEVSELYTLQLKLESRIPTQFRFLSETFNSDSKRFSSYVDKVRKWKVREEGWKRAVIPTEFGVNKTGVFRSVLSVLRQVLKEKGGLKCIKPFSKLYMSGERRFSAPWNSRAMEEFQSELPSESLQIAIALYSDGATLSKSGSQSANMTRVKFLNITEDADVWYEVGIAPRLDCGDEVKKENEKRKERMSIFQRYLHIMLKDISKASRSGFLYEGKILYPRLAMIVADQPQERAFFCLKNADSFRDCSLCIMPSKSRSRLSGDCKGTIEKNEEPANIEEEHARKHEAAGSDITELQAKARNAPSRNVSATVLSQLVIAYHKRGDLRSFIGGHISDGQIDMRRLLSECKNFLEQMSAHEFPPSLAGFAGLGTRPYRLYQSIAFDKLHAFDLGPPRDIADRVFTTYDSTQAKPSMARSQFIRILNQRVMDIPPSARLRSLEPFKTCSNERQVGMSGRARREMLPFLGYVMMGARGDKAPDDDTLIQALFLWDKVQQQLCGVNKPRAYAFRTTDQIDTLQKLAQEACITTSNALPGFNTKLHRNMRHLGECLLDFGCIRTCSTDSNETLHKQTKNAYAATNHQSRSIASQLLKARVLLNEEHCDSGQRGVLDTLLLTRQTIQSDDCPANARSTLGEEQADRISELDGRIIEQVIIDVEKTILTSGSVEEAVDSVMKLVHPSTYLPEYEPIKRCRIDVRLSWMLNWKGQHILYGGSDIYRRERRHDGVEYVKNGNVLAGIIQSFYKQKKHKITIAVVRRLEEIALDPENQNVATMFGGRRLGYVRKGNDILLDCVGLTSLRRGMMVIRDLVEFSTRYGSAKRVAEVEDTIEDRKHAKFFEVKGFQYTALEQQTFQM